SCLVLWLAFYWFGPRPVPHSFPTRRSSDLSLVHRFGEVAAAQVLEGQRHDLDRGAGVAHLAPRLVEGAAQPDRDLQRAEIRVLGAAPDLRVLAEEGRQQSQVVSVQPSARERRAMQRHDSTGFEGPGADLLEAP